MKTLKITSDESLDSAVAAVIRDKILLTKLTAQMDADVATIQRAYAERLASRRADIAADEADIHDYCVAHRAELFAAKKSRETAAGVFGFELTPPRVEPASRKIKWADVVDRLTRLAWGKAYVRQPEPKPDKEALLADREKLTDEQITSAGIQFAQDEQFFIRPGADTAEDTTRKA